MKNILLAFLLLLTAKNLSAQFVNDSINIGGEYRYYHVHVPANYNGTSNLPLVMAFHGGGNQGWGSLVYQSELTPKSDSSGFLLVFPEGKKYSFTMFFGWNAGVCCYPNSTNNSDDVGFVNILLDTLLQNYHIDTNRIYAAGSSVGGMFAQRLGCELSNRIAAVGSSHSTQGYFDCQPVRAIPTINIHSKADSLVYYAGGFGTVSIVYGVYLISQDSLLNNWKLLNSCQTIETVQNGGDSTYTFIQIHDCACSTVTFDHYATTDGGHTWAGGPPTGTTPVSNQVNTTDLMWSFFSLHSLHECDDTVVNHVSQIMNNDLMIYPNPVINEFSIITSFKGTLAIYDLLGQKLFEQKIIDGNNKIIFKPHCSGLFIVKLFTAENMFEQKIIFSP